VKFNKSCTARPSRDGRAVMWRWEERHGRSMAWARHDKCESDTSALCKSNGKDTFWTLNGTAWALHEHVMGTACYVWIGLEYCVNS